MKLIAIEQGYNGSQFISEPDHAALVKKMQTMYSKTGFNKPWIAYFALVDEIHVGTCGFKNSPENNRVEIAYATFAGFENKGYGTEMCRLLTNMAVTEDPVMTVFALTLKQNLASQRILKKNNYTMKGTTIDPKDGIEVLEWEYWVL